MASNVTLGQAIDEYQATLGGMSPSMQKATRSYCGQLLALTGNVLMRNLTDVHVHRFFYGHADANWQSLSDRLEPSSFNTARAQVVRFFGWCRDVGYLRRDLVTSKTVPAKKVGRRPKEHLSVSQMLDALEGASAPDRAVLACAMNTGMRTAELSRLRIRDVDLGRGQVYVHVAKGSKRDEMPLTAELEAELRRWLTWYTEWAGGRHARSCNGALRTRTCSPVTQGLPLCPDWFLLPPSKNNFQGSSGLRSYGLTPWDQHTRMLNVASRALVRLGVKEMDGPRTVGGRGTGMHTFRRSAAQAVLGAAMSDDAGRDEALMITQSFLHHESVTTTEIYLDMNVPREKRDVLLRGGSFLTRPATGVVVPLRAAEQ